MVSGGITAADIGMFMSGVAAILAALAPVVIAFWNRLGHVNHAVNGVAPGEPTLRQVSVVTADIAVALAEKLGQLDSKVDDVVDGQTKQSNVLMAHTEQDTINFTTIRVGTEELRAGLADASTKIEASSARMEEIATTAVETARLAAEAAVAQAAPLRGLDETRKYQRDHLIKYHIPN